MACPHMILPWVSALLPRSEAGYLRGLQGTCHDNQLHSMCDMTHGDCMTPRQGLMQVHALVIFGPASNTLARLKWFASIKYIIGGQEYSSNDIEHGVLRDNKPSPANLLSLVGLSSLAPKTFKPGDPRISQVIALSQP